MLRLLLAWLLLPLCSLLTCSAQAEPLSEVRSRNYYYLHSGLTFMGVAGTALEEVLTLHHGAGYDLDAFGPDDVVRANFSDSAAQLSDKLLVASVMLPLAVQASQGFDTSMGNASLILAEASSLNLFLNSSVKLLVRRPRPYTHSKDSRIVDFADRQGSDAYRSFYSGHTSSAFAAATTGSILYSMRTDEPWARHTVWGLEFLLAGVTAQLRVRAGRHYRTDIWVGSLAGIAVGALVPALHELELDRIQASELAVAGGSFGVTMLLSELVDFCSLLDTLHLCGLPRDVRVPLRDASLTSPTWLVLPTAFPSGGGLMLSGRL